MDPKFLVFLGILILVLAGFRLGGAANIVLVVATLGVALGLWFWFRGMGSD